MLKRKASSVRLAFLVLARNTRRGLPYNVTYQASSTLGGTVPENFEGEGFLPFVPFRQATDEEIAAYKERHAQDLGIGNVHYDLLPSFNPNATCPKCGMEHVSKCVHMAYQHEGHLPKEAGDHDCMLCQCRRCGFRWVTRTKDATYGNR